MTLWLAFNGSAIFALPLAVVIVGPFRHLIELWAGRRYRVAGLGHPACKGKS